MKKKVKYILIAIGVALIIFGALIPTIFKIERDKLAFYRDMGVNDYSCHITITSKNDYQVNSAVVYFEDFFGKKGITKEISSSSVTKTQTSDSFVYTFVVKMESFGEYSEFSKIEKVSLNTNMGTRLATESTFKWTTPVMVIMIIAGAVCFIIGVTKILVEKNQKLNAEKARKELAETHPEINTNNMTDEEVLAKQRELKLKEFKEGNGLASLFGVETQPKEKVCEYCGASNSADAKKCSSCGANLKSKK